MTESNNQKTNFTGTYFDRDMVLRVSRWANILSWVILVIYLLGWLLSLTQFLIQFFSGLFFQKGMSFIDLFNIFAPYLQQPLPGLFYFIGLQAIDKLLVMFLDIEDNTRRAARKN